MKKQLPNSVKATVEKVLETAKADGWDKQRIKSQVKNLAWQRSWCTKTEREVLEYIDQEM